MTAQDFRCLLSGVSLFGAQTALVLVGTDFTDWGQAAKRRPGGWRPVTLPLFGVYDGAGGLEDVSEGPHSRLLHEVVAQEFEAGELRVDWGALGVDPDLGARSFEHLESFLQLVATAVVSAPTAIDWRGRALGFALASAHVFAGLAEREVQGELGGVAVDELPGRLLGETGPGARLYRSLRGQPVGLRCRFGLSFAGLAAVDQWLSARGGAWTLPGPATPYSDEAARRWAADALERGTGDDQLLAALQDFLTHQAETAAEALSE